jgi:hypothetical protein
MNYQIISQKNISIIQPTFMTSEMFSFYCHSSVTSYVSENMVQFLPKLATVLCTTTHRPIWGLSQHIQQVLTTVSQRYSSWSMGLILHVHLEPKSRTDPCLPLYLCGVMIKYRVNYCTLYFILINSKKESVAVS